MPSATRSCPACQTPLPEAAHFCLNCGTATPTAPEAPERAAPTAAVETNRVRTALAERFRIERIIGEGGMATVYLAEDLKHQRQVALKIMRPELAATVGAERFLREIAIAARLSHPHILPVHDSGQADGLLFYVMPFVDGESLRERLLRVGQMPADEAVRLAREIAEALGHAHKRGIIHRDIKPGNILLSEGHALVMDFGIARALEGGEALTQTGLAVGTPQYMSPEQASGAAVVDARADVYAVGGVLYEMLAGEPPFSGPTPHAVIARALTEDPRPLRATRPALPEALERVVQRAMAKSPADRFQTAGDLAEALGAALDIVRSGSTTPTLEARGPAPGRIAALFGVGSALVLAAIYGIMRQVGLPPWMFALAVGLIAAGLPIMMVTGREERRRLAGAAGGGVRRLFTWRNAIGGGALAILFWAVVATSMVAGRPTAAADHAVRLAVLPFENRGAAEDDYFVEGIADEIRGKLLNLPGFAVIARSSSGQYRDSGKPLQEIGRELGADYLLTATVRWAKAAGSANRVQVVPELVDAKTGAIAWQQSFDAALTDVFQVQSDIAVRVAGALDVALGASEQRELEARPTNNLAAYDAYLKGEKARQVGGLTAFRQAVNAFEQAVALDSTFALAWARLSRVESQIFFAAPTPDAAGAARRAAERAMTLAPRLPESHLALGTYYQNVLFDFDKARQQFEEGLRIAPNDVDLLVASATNERSRGRSDAQLALLERAQSLDPRSSSAQANLATTLLWVRRPREALEATDRALSLSPTNLSMFLTKVMVHLAMGDLAGARAVLRSTPPEVEPTRLVAFVASTWDLFWALDDDQQQLLLRLAPGAFDDDRGGWGLALAATSHLRGDDIRARAYGDSAAIALQKLLDATPDDNYLLAMQAVAFAYAGRRDEAIRAGERSVELLPIAKDAYSGAYNQHELARVYAILGDADKTIDQLEGLLVVPYFLTPAWLRVDPTFAFLKGNPRFERLVTGS